jgi:hypothetical protein
MVDSYSGEDIAGDVRANGLPATGRVLRIWETGVRINNNPVVGFLLEIHAEGIEPYEAETKALISILWIPRIQPGEILPVKYDPDDPSRVALDIYEDERHSRPSGTGTDARPKGCEPTGSGPRSG